MIQIETLKEGTQMKSLIVFLISILSISANAANVPVKHKTCQAVLSLGGDGRYIMHSTYRLDMKGYASVVKKALESKGYRVIETLNYDDISAFGKEGIKRSQDKNALAFEFRVAAPSYNYEGTEKHQCGGSLKLTNPKSEATYSVSDANGDPVGSFTTYQPLFDRELETEISSWIPVRYQCQSVFDALRNALPSCTVE